MSGIQEQDLYARFTCQHNFIPTQNITECPMCKAEEQSRLFDVETNKARAIWDAKKERQEQLDRIEEMLKKLLNEKV